MSKCHICGTAPTVKSHLLPRALGLDTRDDSTDLYLGSISKLGFDAFKAGLFDYILCEAHERMLNPFDTYAVEFCRTFEDKQTEIGNGRFLIKPVDTELLVRFVVSVLWRFSVSTRREAPRVNLGPFQSQFQDIVFAGASCSSEPALILWANESHQTNVKGLAILPASGRHLDRRYWSFMIAGISFVLKVDKQPTPARIAPLVINGRDFILSAYKPFDGSYEFQTMLKIAANMTSPRERPLHRR